MRATLLVEIGCEEIPARMIPAGAAELAARLTAILDGAGLARGEATAWGGSRRLAVSVAEVDGGTSGGEERVLGPPAAAAFGPDGRPSKAAEGFARKQGIEAAALERVETEKGVYAGFRKVVPGKTVAEILAAALPRAVATMPFPKTMRWGDGTHRWVRPVHWVVALHGDEVLPMEVFGVASGRRSRGHRFLSRGDVEVPSADAYRETLESAFVVADPERRRSLLRLRLTEEAASVGGAVVPDEELLEEVVDLVEWPGVAPGRFEATFLQLPSEILVTTLRHHQKAFSVRGPGGLVNVFLSVANTDRDPAGHVRRGNTWVVTGRLEDARFFWTEDRKRPLASRVESLAQVTFHREAGSYLDKSRATAAIAAELAVRVGADPEACGRAATLAKADLTTGLVGEFPELQGIVGGLLLAAEGESPEVSRAVYEHYRPSSASDPLPESLAGAVVSVADKLQTIAALVGAGESPSGSRDPFGLRRAAFGAFRVALDRRWDLPVRDLLGLAGDDPATRTFLEERLDGFLRDAGYSANEIAAVRKANVDPSSFGDLPLFDVALRLDVVKTLRGRADFERLVDLTKRVDNILTKSGAILDGGARGAETHASAIALGELHAATADSIRAASGRKAYSDVIDLLSRYTEPVAKFFDDVLVLDPADPGATARRCGLLSSVRSALTHDFDIRELAGEAARRG